MVPALSIVTVLVMVMAGSVLADIPVNCFYPQIVGQWVLHIGLGGKNNTLDCQDFGTKINQEVSSLGVTLYFPDVAVDEHGNEGHWTMVYNQGFELVIGGRKYFAFSKYTKQGKLLQSICDETSNGWSHDINGRDWSCYNGRKIDGQAMTPHVETSEPNASLKALRYRASSLLIDQINTRQTSWRAEKYAEFEDVPLEDMIQMAGGRRYSIASIPTPAPVTAEQMKDAATLPESFDWRDVNGINYVPPVRNQGGCGSCYSFAALSMLEARWRIASNNTQTPIFSRQDIIECSKYSQGCAGGFAYLIAGKYAEDFGLVLEECNKYRGRNGKCHTSRDCPRYYATDYDYIGGFYGACNEPLMRLNLFLHGPIAVALKVYGDFFHYKSGIYYHLAGLENNEFDPFEEVTHAVTLVGYGTDGRTGEDYWIAQNSYSTSFGEDGYFRIRRGTNECAIESMAAHAFAIL